MKVVQIVVWFVVRTGPAKVVGKRVGLTGYVMVKFIVVVGGVIGRTGLATVTFCKVGGCIEGWIGSVETCVGCMVVAGSVNVLFVG